jgi:Asp-tRNA(Asn)/Glu-tRNA(Gln) amidotransferase A subunit family amidase
MTRTRIRIAGAMLALAGTTACGGTTPPASTPAAAAAAPFQIEETTIAQIHAAMRAKTLTCRALVEAYLARIEAYDKKGPALNAITLVNPDALKLAAERDAQFARGGLSGPLHCIPAVVKDNFETIGMMSADGSLALKGFVSDKDAFQVKRIKDAGAIVIAKTNMAEFAFSPYETLNSLQGHTRNPYALDRVPAGSSGGTAAAVASNFAAIGLGSDTGNSIRGPSSHNALSGIRSTMGLTSRAGVIPLSYLADIAGPMTRSVEDMTIVFQAIVGEDPEDPVTERSRGRKIPDYRASLVKDGLKGTRIGILRSAYETPSTDAEIVQVFTKALDDLRTAGAEVVDGVTVTRPQRAQGTGTCRGFRYDMDDYLKTRGARAPVHSLDEIIASPSFAQFPASVQSQLKQRGQGAAGQGPGSDACKADAAYREAFGAAVTKAMDDAKLDAFVYPTWSNPPRLIGDLKSPHGDNSQVFSPTSGFPAITVPMGYTRDATLPAGMTFFGRAWDEARLIRLAYAYEQATHHRRPPKFQ